jgi:cytochrome c biogenesis protein CcmG, thiol:disulfide interchange protein DsbE
MRGLQGRRYLLVAALVIGALAAIEVATNGGGARSGRSAPALPSEILTPPRMTVASLRGKPALINFWASWCGPCAKEAPELARLSRNLRGSGTLVGVDWNDALSGARGFIRKYGWTFPNLRDADGVVGNRYGLSGLPNTFVLDRSGRIVQVLRGPQTAAGFERALRAAG